jgi:hypothetical protein
MLVLVKNGFMLKNHLGLGSSVVAQNCGFVAEWRFYE